MRVRLTEKEEEEVKLLPLCKKLWAIRPPAKEILLSLASKQRKT